MSKPALSRYSRRAFLAFLAGSPYVAGQGGIPACATDPGQAIADPKDALSVMDFEAVARRKMAPVHWAFLASGVDDDGTVRANQDGFRHVELRPRRLRDATRIDTRTELFGTAFDSPIFTCPTSGEKLLHPDGELVVARATRKCGVLQMLSTSTSTGVEQVNAAHGRPVWYQLYAPGAWDVCVKIVRRVEAAGCPVIALTVDNTTGRNTESYLRTLPKDRRQCLTCHQAGLGPAVADKPMYDGIDMRGVSLQNPAMTWEFVDRLRKATTLKLFLKGIDTGDDARLAVEHGIDGIVVSNHGGRATETDRSTIEALPEIVSAVGGRIPVLLDGGVRRGTDVFKALALGAKAVGIGRPFLWGLGAFGQAGVERVLEILQGELKLAMANCGTPNIAAIDRTYVATSGQVGQALPPANLCGGARTRACRIDTRVDARPSRIHQHGG
jgi:isopentenyl diphosphate isomerase/L-lactate dehydrogenase-like FMN-dependent dehydrogenase